MEKLFAGGRIDIGRLRDDQIQRHFLAVAVNLDGNRVAGCQGCGGFDAADGIQVVAQTQRFVEAGLAFDRDPGRCKIMLNDGDPAIVGLFDVVGLAFVDVRKRDFLILLF